MVKAFAYLRTSSAANVGEDKDSPVRQRLAIDAYAASAGVEIVGEFYDAAVKGSDEVHDRPGFKAMMAAMVMGGVTTIIVQSADRFSRTLVVQEQGIERLRLAGFSVVVAERPTLFTSDLPVEVFVRQIMGSYVQMDKANLVLKLRGARDRKRAATGRCEGRKPAPEAARAIARTLRAQGKPLLAIAYSLADEGFTAPSGRVYSASSVKSMLKAA